MRGPRSAPARSRRQSRREFVRDHSKEAAHTSLEDYIRSLLPGESHGDVSTPTSDRGVTKVVFQNVNGLPANPLALKQQQINKWLHDESVGIAMFAETNRHWPSLPDGTNWRDRMRLVTKDGYFASSSFNRHQPRDSAVSSFQYGGTAVPALNSVSHASKEYGVDPSGMGRWSYIRLCGKKKLVHRSHMGEHRSLSQDLVVISAYRPNLPGNRSLYSVCSTGDLHGYSAAIQVEVAKWRNEGCEIILGVDANEDISLNDVTSFRNQMQMSGLDEAILRRHPVPQATYQRNLRNVPIDGLFVSPGVIVRSCGYYAFDEFFLCDHQGLWMDIDLKATLGGHLPQKLRYKARLLSTQDDRCVKRYLRQVNREYLRYRIPQRLQALSDHVESKDNKFDEVTLGKFNCLHRQAYSIQKAAESSCRKRSMGRVPWSPCLQEMWDHLALWKFLIKSRKRCRVSSRKVRRLMHKTGNLDAWRWSTEDIEAKLRDDR